MNKRIKWHIEKRLISDLKPYQKNPRIIEENGLNQLKESFDEIGMAQPININTDNTILSGHARTQQLKKENPNQKVDVYVPDRLLTPKQEEAVIIRMNKNTAGEWDYKSLGTDFELNDLVKWGFDPDEIELPEEVKLEPGCDEDDVPEVKEDPITKRGDIWLLGDHRVMCGDSTMIDDVEKLMDNKKADFGFCDPPYNLGFNYNSYDDNKTSEEYLEFSNLWFSNLQQFSDRQAVTLGTKNIEIMSQLDSVAGVACWVKKNWITSCHIAKLQQWEPIFFYGDYTKLKRTSDLYEINRVIQKDVGDKHTCPKQIALIEDIFNNYSKALVIDLFLGSGTSLIACEKTNRKCYGMELDEHYCDVICQRWSNFTGKDPILESTGEKYSELRQKTKK